MKFTGQYTMTIIDEQGNPFSFMKPLDENEINAIMKDARNIAILFQSAAHGFELAKLHFDKKNQPSETSHPNL